MFEQPVLLVFSVISIVFLVIFELNEWRKKKMRNYRIQHEKPIGFCPDVPYAVVVCRHCQYEDDVFISSLQHYICPICGSNWVFVKEIINPKKEVI
ncbi:hypothetical protein KO465_06295 [Candidatus Micrarchaeota archaeon]|nr:hypothetical protein [Candidatus Micrarchaeota archaeon]